MKEIVIMIPIVFAALSCKGQTLGETIADKRINPTILTIGDIGYFHDELVRDSMGKLIPKNAHKKPQLLGSYFINNDSLVIYGDTIKFLKAVMRNEYQYTIEFKQ